MPNGKKSYQQFLEEFRAPAAIAPSPAPPQYPTPQYPPQEPAKEGWWDWLMRYMPWTVSGVRVRREELGIKAARAEEVPPMYLTAAQKRILEEHELPYRNIYEDIAGKQFTPTTEEYQTYKQLPFHQQIKYEAPFWAATIGVSALLPTAGALQARLLPTIAKGGKTGLAAKGIFQVLRPIAATERLQARALNSIISKLRPFRPEKALQANPAYQRFLKIKPSLPLSEQARIEQLFRSGAAMDAIGHPSGKFYRYAIWTSHPEVVNQTEIPQVFIKAFPGWEKAGGLPVLTAESWAVITPANQDILLKALGAAKPTPGTVGTAWTALPATVRAILAGVPEPEAPPLVKAPTPEEEAEEMTAPMLEEILGRKITTLEELAAARDEYRRRLRGQVEAEAPGIPPVKPPVPGVPGMEVPDYEEEVRRALEEVDRILKEIPPDASEAEAVRRVHEAQLAFEHRLLVDLGGMKAVPPYLIEGREPTVGDLSELVFGEKTPAELLTSQEQYAKRLGAGPLMAPLFIATGNRIKLEQLMKPIILKKFAQLSRPAKAKMYDWLNTYEEPPPEVTGKDREVFIWFRNLTQTMINAENQVRVMLGLEPIKYREAYIRNIALSRAGEAMLDPSHLPASLKDLSVWVNRIVSPRVWNPMEFERIEKELAEALGIVYQKDLKQSLLSMVHIGLKEIFLTQPLKMFDQHLKEIGDAMPRKTREFLKTLVNVSIKGQQTGLDEEAEHIFQKYGPGGIIDKFFKAFGKSLGSRPFAALSHIMGRLVISAALGPRPDILIRNLFQNIQNLGLAGLSATLKSFLPADEMSERLIKKSLFYALYHGFEELPAETQRKVERAWLWLYGKTAVFNARQGMKAAYHHYNPYFEDPKHKDFWSLRRTGKEPRGFRYPEEEEFLLMLMEYDSGITQYVYSVLGMPGIYRHKTLAAVLRLQSWWMNYFAKFWPEMLHRMLTGKIGYDWGPIKMNPLEPGVTLGVPPEPPDGITIEVPPEGDEWRPQPKANWKDRYKIFLYVLLGGAVLDSMGYRRSFMFGVLPGRFAPTANILIGTYKYAAATNESQREAALRQMFEGYQMHLPTHLTYEEFERAFTGGQPWSKVFFYKESWPPGIPAWGLPPLEAVETIRTSQAKLGTTLLITEEERKAAKAEGREPVAEIYELADARRDINRDVGIWGLFSYPIAKLGEERTKLGELIRNANDWIGRYERIPTEPSSLRRDFRRQYTDEAATAEAYLFMFGKVSSLQSPKGEGYKSWAVIQDLIKEYNIPLEAIPNYAAEASKQRAIAQEEPTVPPAPPYQPPTGELGYEEWIEEFRK